MENLTLKTVIVKRLQDIFSDVKWANLLIEEGKEVPADRKLQGVRTKMLALMKLISANLPDELEFIQENISDGEIREIQVLTDERYPGAIANIGGVTSGCPCEEGPDCDSQVWILAHRDDRYDGLLLSRVNSKWTIGSIQQWWFKYDQFQKRAREARAERKPESRYYYSDYLDELRQLQDAFPSCLVPEQDLQVQDGVEPRN